MKNIPDSTPHGSPELPDHSEKQLHWIDRVKTSKRYENADEKLVWEAFKRGDEAAFIHIYIRYFNELLNFGRQFARDKTVIEDIIQNTFIHLRDKRQTLPPLKSSIRLFLFQCFKRKFFDHQKVRKHILSTETELPFEIVLAEDARMIIDQNYQEKLEKLERSIKKLNSRQREIIYYYYYNNFTYEEIKSLMGFGNIKSVRNFVYKTIALLKKFID